MSKKKKGIDISVWQGNIDAGQIKNSGIDFVIIREGYRQAVDSRFFDNVKKCKEVGLAVMGVYHFSYALNAEQAKQEAQLAVANLEKAGLSKDTIVFFDFEYDTVTKAAAAGVTLGKTECNAHTKAFCETAESLGYRAGVYFNIDYYRNWYDHALLDQYIKWLADWTGDADYPCDFHQYTSKGSVPGISGNVDMNYYFVPEVKEDAVEAGNAKPAVVAGVTVVKIGHASIDENGKITGGVAGDQTGKEICTRDWYNKPWISVIRPNDSTVAEKIAKAMEQACANDKIGYDQKQRTTLYTFAKSAEWDLSKITTACECDCSSLVAVCVNAAGIAVSKDIYTGNEQSALKATGKFTILTDSKYISKSENLRRGDILLASGHTAVVLSNGFKAGESSETVTSGTDYKVGDVVLFTGTKHYTSSNDTNAKTCKAGNAKITAIATGAKHPYHLVHTDNSSNVYGWVDTADIGGISRNNTTGTKTHMVVKGDTLSAIANKNGTTVAKIVEANKSKYPKITENYIVIGWTLNIPQ